MSTRPALLLLFLCRLLPAQTAALPTSFDDLMREAGRAISEHRTADAETLLHQASRLEPRRKEPHLRLALLSVREASQTAGGVTAPASAKWVQQAEAEFKQVITLDPNYVPALMQLAGLERRLAQTEADDARQNTLYDEAVRLYRQAASVDPANRAVYRELGGIALARSAQGFRQAWMPGSPPQSTPGAKANLQQKYASMLDEGIADTTRALQLDPADIAAMNNMAALLLERSKLRDLPVEAANDQQAAEQWRIKAKEEVLRQAASQTPGRIGSGGIGSGFGGGVGSRTGIGPGEGGVYRIGGGVSQPRLISKIDPSYSEEARQAKIQGTVVLSIIIDMAGTPQSVRVIRGLGSGLDEEAIKAVQQWRFEPGRKEGQPVPVIANVEVNFRLLDKAGPAPPRTVNVPPRRNELLFAAISAF